MATSTPSTAYSRDLGDELRKVRESSTDLTGAAFALRLGWDPSKVSTLENGKYRPSEIDLVQYLSMLGKDIDFFEDFKRRFRYAFEEYIVQISDNLRTLAMAESTSVKVTSYDAQAMPGLSQTPEYADSLYRMGGYIVEERIPEVVQCRIDRQAILNRHDRPACLFYIHEHALQTQVGDAQTMEDQYAKLLFGAPTIRIVPASAKLVATSCVLWEYEKVMPIAFTSTDLAKVFVQDPAAIARTRLLFDRLAEVASMRNNRGGCWRTTSADRERNSMSEARAWRKSSYSGATEDDNCVEVSLGGDALVRDSKDPSGSVLTFSFPAWEKFLETR